MIDHIEQIIDMIAEAFGDEIADKIMNEDSYALLIMYSAKLKIDRETVDELINNANTFGW